MGVASAPVAVLVPDQSPLAVQDVGLFVAFQVKVVVSLTYTDAGLVDMVTMGAPTGALLVCVITPTGTVEKPVPVAVVHVSVK